MGSRSRSARTAAPLLLLALSGLAVSACETTQDKATALAEQGEELVANQEGVVVKKINKDVKVLSAVVVSGELGEAVAVELQNTSNEAQVNLPINIDVLDANGKSVFTNDIPGLLGPGLTSVPLLLPGETSYWVNDQLLTTGQPKSVKAKVGNSRGAAPDEIPELAVSEPRLNVDSTGIEAEGQVENKSDLTQEEVALFAVAIRGGEVVAAGRGAFKRLDAGGKPLNYNIFFRGDPTGADVQVFAPPTVLE